MSSAAVADITPLFMNGATTPWSEKLFEEEAAESLVAYGGWNTVGNTLGFALGARITVKVWIRLISQSAGNKISR